MSGRESSAPPVSYAEVSGDHLSATGEAISGPVPAEFGHETPPPMLGRFLQNVGLLMQHVRTESICTYPTKLEAGWVRIMKGQQSCGHSRMKDAGKPTDIIGP